MNTAAAAGTAVNEPLDPQIKRFAQLGRAEMEGKLAAEIIGISYKTLVRLCENEMITARRLNGARGVSNNRWTITKAALITYIVRSTGGDRSHILSSIAEACPRWLPVAQRAAELPAPQPGAHTRAGALQQRLRRPHDAFAGHPDLFLKQSA